MTDSQRKRDFEQWLIDAKAATAYANKSCLQSFGTDFGPFLQKHNAFLAGLKHCRDTEVKELRELCDKMSLNSLKIEIERDEFREQLRVAVEALEQVVKHEQDSLKYDSEIHKFNRYRENMYFKCLEALQKIEAMKGGGE